MPTDRYIDIRSGKLMVVSDLHGDGEAFDRVVATFIAMREEGEVDRLVFLGDVLHGYGNEADDASLRMLLGIMDLQERFGKDNIVLLLGNHEMPHIYGVSLAKGDMEFTPRFERVMGSHREKVTTFLKSLPFLIRTSAGVMFCHAGPDESSINRVERLRDFDHEDLLGDADRSLQQQGDLTSVYEAYARISGETYESLAKRYLAVSGPEDPRYPHLMRALFISERDHRFGVLWDFLFTQNDRGYLPAVYEQICLRYLDAFGAGAPTIQRVCVSGHISVPEGGHQVVNDRHLRLASATHARPREAGEYLLIDAGKPLQKADELIPLCRRLF
jgi:hypothetical protein